MRNETNEDVVNCLESLCVTVHVQHVRAIFGAGLYVNEILQLIHSKAKILVLYVFDFERPNTMFFSKCVYQGFRI